MLLTLTCLAGLLLVHDGDTIKCPTWAESVRLVGIDAPELRQACQDADGRPWPCGVAARDAVATMTAQEVVTCFIRGTDRYGRYLADCQHGWRDIGADLVGQGLAVPYLSPIYEKDAAIARQAQRGMWAGAFQLPKDWRKAQR